MDLLQSLQKSSSLEGGTTALRPAIVILYDKNIVKNVGLGMILVWLLLLW